MIPKYAKSLYEVKYCRCGKKLSMFAGKNKYCSKKCKLEARRELRQSDIIAKVSRQTV